MLRIVAALAALCAAAFLAVAAWHRRKKDPRLPSQGAVGWAVILLMLSTMVALARPSPYPPVTQFVGDRYASAQLGPEVVKSAKAKQGAKARAKSPSVSRRRLRHVPTPRPRSLTSEPYRVEAPISIGEGVRREASRVIGGRPQGCPRLFCGCGASLHLFGRIIPALNLAANWLRFPRAEPAPKMAAARRGHVFVLERHIAGKVWLVHDSNSGHGRTRLHPRSIAGYTIVNPRGSG